MYMAKAKQQRLTTWEESAASKEDENKQLQLTKAEEILSLKAEEM